VNYNECESVLASSSAVLYISILTPHFVSWLGCDGSTVSISASVQFGLLKIAVVLAQFRF